jgi:peptidoglycan/LPS O-acetylase OafA/YrhL
VKVVRSEEGVGEVTRNSLAQMRAGDERAVLLGAAISIVASLLLTVLAAALESTINGPGSRVVAPPVLWALGGGVGLALGAMVASSITRRVWPGVLAAFLGAVPLLVLVILGYNSGDLKTSDQIMGSLIVVVLPAFLAAVVFAALAAFVARQIDRATHRGSALPAGR